LAPNRDLYDGPAVPIDHNRGDSGGPLLVRGWWDRAFRQVGVGALGSDCTLDLYAGFTSLPVEAGWIAQSIKALRLG
jgi:secreted trypsin-like serine protease